MFGSHCLHPTPAQWSAEQAGKTSEDFPCLPDHVGQYHTLYPMEEPAVDGNDRVSLGKRGLIEWVED